MKEHGLASSYADFMITVPAIDIGEAIMSKPILAVPDHVAIPVQDTSHPGAKYTKVTVVTSQTKFAGLQRALDEIGVTGITVTNVLGYGMQKGNTQMYRGVPVETKLLAKVQVDIVITKIPVDLMVKTIKEALYTGNIGDGKIFVYNVENAIKVRTGEEGYDALQDEDYE